MDAEALKSRVLDAVSDLNAVQAVYLFGSASEGRERPGSDVDLAVLFAEGSTRTSRLELSLEIRARVEASMGRRADVVPLNDAHSSLAFRAIRGRLLVDRDPVARCLYAVRTISRYHDYRRFLQAHVPSMEARAREGRFGTAR